MSKIIENKKQVIEYFEKGFKPRQLWKIGTEHEKFLYHLNTLKPIDYHGKKGIKSLFKLLKKKGWEEIIEDKNPIALKKKNRQYHLSPDVRLNYLVARLKLSIKLVDKQKYI